MSVPEQQGPASAGPAVTLSTRGVTKIYRTGEVEVQALRGVDLDLYEAELVVLLGASGSGKSTLLNILGGLDQPSAGQVFLDGEALTGRGEGALTRYGSGRRAAYDRDRV